MIPFLLKSALILGLVFALYKVLLEREKMPRFNRFYLLVGLVVAFVLPLLTIPMYVAVEVPVPKQVFTTIEMPASLISEAVTPQHKQEAAAQNNVPEPTRIGETINYLPYVLWGIYGIVTLLLATRFLLNTRRFFTIANRNIKVELKGATVVLLNNCPQPHTFLNFIFVDKEQYENQEVEAEVLTHELAHVKQKHTVDVLFIELLKTVFWFNPLLYLYKKAIQTNHEFLADEAVISRHLNIPVYQLLLLDKATPVLPYALASSLNFSTTKKRFTMMTKTTTKTRNLLLKVLLIPALAAIIMAFANKEVLTTSPQITDQKGNRIVDDSLNYKQRRDAFYKGVKVDIDDRIEGVHLMMPYEKLTENQKRKYKLVAPYAVKPQKLTQKELDKLHDVKKYYVSIDGIQADNAALKNRKANDFASYIVLYRAKESLTKERPQFAEYHLYTPGYYNKNFTEAHVTHFPDSVYKIQVFNEVSKDKVVKREMAITYNVATVMQYLDDKEPVNYTNLDKVPQYKTGIEGFNTFIKQHLKLPDTAPKHISTYYLTLIVEADGIVSRVRVINAEDAETPKAFASVLEKAGTWKPGILKGKTVRSQYTVTVTL